jgi:hypothetical protein
MMDYAQRKATEDRMAASTDPRSVNEILRAVGIRTETVERIGSRSKRFFDAATGEDLGTGDIVFACFLIDQRETAQ